MPVFKSGDRVRYDEEFIYRMHIMGGASFGAEVAAMIGEVLAIRAADQFPLVRFPGEPACFIHPENLEMAR